MLAMVDLLDMHLFRELIVSSGSGLTISLAWENTKQSVPTISCDVRFGYQIRLRYLSCCLPLPLPTIMSNAAPANSDPETKPTVPEPTVLAPADADEEPQNALTQKFTEKEWVALKEFRVRAVQDSSFSAQN
jgi:hypothetical protein